VLTPSKSRIREACVRLPGGQLINIQWQAGAFDNLDQILRQIAEQRQPMDLLEAASHLRK
jgi:hypothetical protein